MLFRGRGGGHDPITNARRASCLVHAGSIFNECVIVMVVVVVTVTVTVTDTDTDTDTDTVLRALCFDVLCFALLCFVLCFALLWQLGAGDWQLGEPSRGGLHCRTPK